MKSIIFLTLLFFNFSHTIVAETLTLADDFTLKSNSGENFRLSEHRGEVILVNFWASWCGPCRQEMPELDKLHKKYQKLGFTVLGVNVEPDSSPANALLSHNPVSFPILYDSENSASKAYAVKGMPTTVIIDRDGNKRFLHESYKPGFEKTYEKQIKQLLRE